MSKDVQKEERNRRLKARRSKMERYYFIKSYPDIYLTPRELKVAMGLVKRFSHEAIAQELSLGARTIEYYIHTLKLKFKLLNEEALVAFLDQMQDFQPMDTE